MARGNDAAAAAAEFRGQYGLSGNAEDLIQANRAAYPADLRSASLLPVNEDATRELSLDAVSKKIGGRVIGASVRGDKVVAVVETESQHTYKEVLDASDLGVDVKAHHGASVIAPNVGDDANYDTAKAAVEARALIEQARKDAEKIIQDAIAEAQEKANEGAQKAAEEARKSQQKAAEQAAKDAEKSSGASAQDKEAAKEQKQK